jgi:hypothetical protein
MVESADYQAYMANLRAIGCPERTIRDIILADLERFYVEKTAAIPFNACFWECGDKRVTAQRQQEQKRAALKTELGDLVRTLLGVDYFPSEKQDDDELAYDAVMRFILGPLPEDVAQTALIELRKAQALVDKLENRGNGFELPETESQVRQAGKESLARLRALLGPEGFDEFASRTAALYLMNNGYEKLKASPAEWRQIARMHVAICGLSPEKSFEIFGSSKVDDEVEQRFQARLQEYVGPTRWTEFVREKDPVFRSALALAEQNRLPRETAAKIYDIKQLLETEKARAAREGLSVAGNPEASREAIASTAVLGVQKLLGPALFRTYLAQGQGYWLTNFVIP